MEDRDYFQCVPNFSEGRNLKTVEGILKAIRSVPGANIVDSSWDWDHNRSVITILGGARAIENAVFEAARTAVATIDLRSHSGVHPRIGAIDVIPIIPILQTPRELAIQTAERIASRIGSDLSVPVYLYEWNAKEGRRSALPELRKGGFEGIQGRELDGAFAPDFGPHTTHFSAGACVVGARSPLAAYNVNLLRNNGFFGGNLEWNRRAIGVARKIALQIRQERKINPIFKGVRALGLLLESRNCAQVSLNLTLPEHTPIPPIFRYIQEQAYLSGIETVESEVIGVVPEIALGGEKPESIRWVNYKNSQILRV